MYDPIHKRKGRGVSDWAILSALGDDEARGVLTSARRRRFKRGEVVFHRDDPADTLHLVSSGCLAVRVITPLGSVATLQLVGPGECFGELALLGGAHVRSAKVEAISASETYALSRTDLDRLRAQHREIDAFLVELLGQRVAELTERLVEALYTPAPRRVRLMLDGLAERYREPSGRATIPLTQDDLAGLAGTSRLTVNRVLHELQRAGQVEIGRGRVTVLAAGAGP
ncbi:MAG TPA: Crp/Fnr family transcriptional regulator [Gaiellales bacterium]|nr:Crp/Fnr family transcriptional regulator [Gaiellales bacterium]